MPFPNEHTRKRTPRNSPGKKKEPTKLNERMWLFAHEYIKDFDGTRAAKAAGYSEKAAYDQGFRLLQYKVVQDAIAELKAKRAERLEIDQDRIVRELLAVSLADANGLIEFRRTCCRYCYGEGFKYQRTAGELERDRTQHKATLLKLKAEGIKFSAEDERFDEAGGIGYDPRKDPHKDCPECFGEGEGREFLHDTRKLTPELRALYAGVKRTKDGLQMLMHDKRAFMDLLMRHAGMLNDSLKLKGDAENPLFTLLREVQGTQLRPAGPEPEDE